jgi:hypothetical protein
VTDAELIADVRAAHLNDFTPSLVYELADRLEEANQLVERMNDILREERHRCAVEVAAANLTRFQAAYETGIEDGYADAINNSERW